MNPHDTPLLDLARRMRRDMPRSERFRETLEDSLLPLIRCAIRSRLGNPTLVRWVLDHLPGDAVDPGRAARPMARLLCDRLMERLDPLPGRETVAGP